MNILGSRLRGFLVIVVACAISFGLYVIVDDILRRFATLDARRQKIKQFNSITNAGNEMARVIDKLNSADLSKLETERALASGVLLQSVVPSDGYILWVGVDPNEGRIASFALEERGRSLPDRHWYINGSVRYISPPSHLFPCSLLVKKYLLVPRKSGSGSMTEEIPR